jgi:hypothetical protein
LNPVELGARRGGLPAPIGSRVRAALDGRPAWWSWAAIAIVLAAGAGLLAYETRGTFFWADEWEWILTRRGGGLDTFLQPHNQHFSLVPVALYKLLFATAGLRHYWPYRALLIGVEVICTLLIFIYGRRRAGGLYAVLAAVLMLTFGPGWQDILWPFQNAWILTVVGGVGALLALDRRTRNGDIAACLLLGLSLASASPGIAVAAGLALEVLLTRKRRDLWIVAIPIALYALWWVGYQHTQFSRHALLLLPQFMFNSAAGTLSALAGLAQVNVLNDGKGDFLSWGAPLLVVALVAMAWRLRTLGRIPTRVLTFSTILLVFWFLTGIGRAYIAVGPLVLTSTGDESRYLYIGAAYVILLVLELAWASVDAPVRRGSQGVWAARDRPASEGVPLQALRQPALAVVIAVLVAAAALSNIGPLEAGGTLLRQQAQDTEAELSTMNLSRNIVAPNYVSNGFIFGVVRAQAWFNAEKALGAPPLDGQLVASLPFFAQEAADSQLIKLQNLTLHPVKVPISAAITPPTVDKVTSGTDQASGGCVRFTPAGFAAPNALSGVQVTVPKGGLLVHGGASPVSVSVRRFYPGFLALGTVAPHSEAGLLIKPDLAPQPWHAQITAAAPFAVCG